MSQNNGICVPCTGNTISGSGSASCEACNNDREATLDKTQCLCPNGQFGPATNGVACQTCQSGEFSNSDKTMCQECAPNQIVQDNACVNCQGDLVANSPQRTQCVCPVGHEPGGGSNCRPCDDDQISDGVSFCQTCGEGMEADEDNLMCVRCSGNSVSAGAGNCVTCEPENGMANSAKTQCVFTCDDGSNIVVGERCEEHCAEEFQDYNAGTKSCFACTGNNYFENGECRACHVNSSPSRDRSACECVSGFVTSAPGACTRCPDGMGPNDDGTRCQPCPSELFSKDTGICRSCPSGQSPDNTRTACVNANRCQDGTTARPDAPFNEVCEETCSNVFEDYNSATKSCFECADNQVFNGENCVGCPEDKEPNSAGSVCICPAGETNYPTITGELCADSTLPAYPATTADVYNDDNCRAQGWSVVYDFDSQMRIAEFCEVPVVILSNASTSASALSESVVALPAQLTPNTRHDVCLMRSDAGYTSDFDIQPQPCPMLLGENGFPNALEYGEAERLRVDILAGGQVNVLPRIVESSGDGGGGGSSSDTSAILFGGVAAVVLYSWLLSDGGVESLSLQPQGEVRHNDSGSYYAYGSRLAFAANNWSGYWETLQTHSGGKTGDWIYGAGTEWTGDVFSASLENTTEGFDSDTSLSLSATKQWGNWTLESSYVSDLRIRDVLNTTWQNRLGVGANAVYNKWTVTPKVEFSWQDAELDDEVRFRMNVLREF